MWKAAFSGRSETGSSVGRSNSTKKKTTGSTTSRRSDDEKRKAEKSLRSSTYDDSVYATAPNSRVGTEPRALTESAVRLLDDDDEWEDEDKDARSERRSVRSHGSKHRKRSENEREKERSRSRSRDRDRDGKRKSSSRKSKIVDEGDERAIPDMGSFEQFPGQYAGGVMGNAGRQEEFMMSGALPNAPDNQFGPTRGDSYGAAADYYLDEGQSVHHQPGVRAKSPNMLVNPDLDHLMAASATANPAQDTGHGSAADFYGGKTSPGPVFTEEPQSYSSTPSKPSKSGKKPSSSSAFAAGAAAIGAAGAADAYYNSQSQSNSSYNQQQSTSYSQQQSTSYSQQQSTTSSSKPQYRPNRQTTDPNASGPGGGVYYAPPPQNQGSNSYSGTPGKQNPSQSSNSHTGLYAAGAAAAVGAAGLAAYEMNQHHNQGQRPSMQSSVSPGNLGMQTPYGQAPGYGPQTPQQQQQQMNGHHQHFHEHKGPLTRLKDGLFNLISSEEDTIKMEMYTEYIGVCKYCFDPRTSPYDAPRRHHYHTTSRRDSFDDLRKRRSIDKMRRRSREGLSAAGSRVDKDSRYYSDRKKSGSKTDLAAAGLAAAGVAAGANALFNSDGKNFDDTYSVKSGHRESSAIRRRSRSSSREKRRRSSHGVVGRDGRDSKEEYVTVRTSDGRTERRRVHRSRSSSREKKGSMLGTAAGLGAGAALGAAAMSASGRSRRSREHSPNGAFVRRHSRRSSSSSSSQSGGGVFGFLSPSSSNRKRRGSKSKQQRKRKQGGGGFFGFGNDSVSGSDSDLAFGASRTDLSLRRKNSARNVRKKKSDEHIAATVAGIGATAAALAAAQKGHRVTKRPSGVHLGAKRDVKYATPSGRPGKPVPVDDEWEDELPSDVDDASSIGSDLAFHDDSRKLSHRQSRESIGSQSSGAGGLGAWGWRWGGKDKKKQVKRRDHSPRPAYPPRPSASGVGSIAGAAAAGALAGAAVDAYGRPIRKESIVSSPGVSQEPMQYVDPRPISETSSRHASIPGAFDSSPPVIRPGPGPIQAPKPVAPIPPSFTQRDTDLDGVSDRPKPRRTQSSPVQSNFATDAALIGAAAVGTAALIGSQRRKSKDVRFGFTEEQERKHDAERRKAEDEERRRRERAEEEERQRWQRERDLKKEAERHTREQDVLRAREQENRRAAEAELEKQKAQQREAEEQAEKYRQLEREKNEREEAFKKERERREQRERELTEEIERKRRELEEQKQRETDESNRRKREERRKSGRKREDDAKSDASSSVPWGAVAAGAAAAGVGAVALSEHEKNKDEERESRRDARREDRDRYSAREVTPSYASDASKRVPDDDDVYNREYFNSSSRSRSPDHARHVEELARKAADKVVSARAVLADNEARYQDHQSQAEYFAPEEISHPGNQEPVSREAKPDAGGRAYNAADIKAREAFDKDYAGIQSPPKKFAPYGVPKLNLVSPTPPPSAMKRSQTPPASRSARSDEGEADAEPGARRQSRSRSISWGADQTHVYDVPTPESYNEAKDYMSSRDQPSPSPPPSRDSDIGAGTAAAAGVAATVAAGFALNEAVKDDKTTSRDRKREDNGQYDTREYTPYRSDSKDDYKSSSRNRDESRDYIPYRPEEKDDRSSSQKVPPMYQQPFYESVSDIGINPFKIDSPGTEGAPPVQGFVEGEVADPTSKEERALHIPGGFDDDVYDEPAKSTTSRDVPFSSATETVAPVAEVPDEPAWEPPLSKKEKKKREKAAKRGESIDDATSFSSVVDAATKARDSKSSAEPQSFSSVVDAATKSRDAAAEPQEAAWEPPLSKKEQKKRDKALKRGMSEDKITPTPVEEPLTRDAEPEPAWEPPLTKKEKKKREKEAKKQGFADVAEAMMTTGGIAAAASTMTDTSPATSKGTDRRASRELERDIRDIEPSTIPYIRTPPKESSAMPGGWDSDTKEKDVESPGEAAVDPFQFQVHDDTWAASSQIPEAPPLPSESTTSKASKRESVRFNEPVTSSPLKSEVAFDDKPAEKSVWFAEPEPIANGHSSEADKYPSSATAYDSTKSEPEKSYDERQARSDYKTDDRDVAESPRRISPDDLRSVASDPTGDRESKRRSRESRYGQYSEEPDEYDDARSVAASEPADYGNSRKSKRRSRHEDDDTMSVTSSRSRREKDDSSSAAKKAGFFGGLFGKKAVETMKSDGAPLSRSSTKDSKDGDEDGERKHRRRKHRSSEYADDDDTRSVTSESRRKHRGSEYGDDDDTRSVTSESKSRRRRTRDDLDDYESSQRTSSRPDDDREGEDGRKHHHRRRTDEGDYSSGQRHHHRRKTDEDAYDQDQSFLGMRVEDMPPLPDEKGTSANPAIDNEEQGHGNLVSAERDVDVPMVSHEHADYFGLVGQEQQHERKREEEETKVEQRSHADAFDLIDQQRHHEHARDQEADELLGRRHADAFGRVAHEPGDAPRSEEEQRQAQSSWDDDVEYLPSLPDSRPESPTGLRELDIPQRPTSLQHTTSQSRVPIRFPFGNQPPTPGHRTERSISFGGSLPSSPATPTTQKKSRPTSSEIRPLYLVERNRKTPEVEEALPSLPSSKPSSRASSMVGSDEYESAAEDFSSPLCRRALSIDSSHAVAHQPEEDFLGSGQTTPRATEFPRDPFAKSPRPEPQFYTWEDLMKDERNRQASATDQANNRDLPELPPSRPESRIDSDDESSGALGLAAAAAGGGAAVLGYRALSRSRNRGQGDEVMRDPRSESHRRDESPSRQESFYDDRFSQPMDIAKDVDEKPSRDAETFVENERNMEEGHSSTPIEAYPAASPATNENDDFFDVEEQMEDGEVPTNTIAGDAMDVDRIAAMPVPVATATEHADLVPTNMSPTEDHERMTTADVSMEAPFSQDRTPGRDAVMEEAAGHDDFGGLQPSTKAVEEDSASVVKDTERLMATEDDFEAGKATDDRDTSHDPMDVTAAAEETSISQEDDRVITGIPAGSEEVVEPSHETSAAPQDDNDIQAVLPIPPKLTRKQSKKAKKKEKSASKKREEISERTAAENESSTDVAVDEGLKNVQDEPTAITSLDEEVAVVQDEPMNSVPKSRAFSAGSGAGVAALMSDIMRRGSGNQDATLKAEAVAETSENDAVVHTSLEDNDSSAARQLEASLGPTESVAAENISASQEPTTNVTDVESRSLQDAVENPVLQPETEEPWETSTTVSRKQSKKDKKKKKKQQQQMEVESEPQTEIETERPQASAVGESRDLDTPTIASTAIAEANVGSESLMESQAAPDHQDVSAVDDAAIAAEVPLPMTVDEGLDLGMIDDSQSKHEESAISTATDFQTQDQKLEDLSTQDQAQVYYAEPEVPRVDEMEVDGDRAMDAHASQEQTAPIISTESIPMQVEDDRTVPINDAVEDPITLPDIEASDREMDVAAATEIDEVAEPAPTESETPADRNIASSFEQPSELAEEQAVPQEPEDEFTWSSSKKKGKKGKKSKKAVAATPPSGEIDEPVAQPDEVMGDAQAEADIAMPTPDTSHEAEDPDTFWEAPTTKKKKGKKGKRASDTSIFESAPVDSGPSTAPEIIQSQDLSEEPGQIDDITGQTTLAPVGHEPTTQPLEPLAEEMPASEESREVEDADTFWPTSSFKKKKGKKGKRSSITPAFETRFADSEPSAEPELSQSQDVADVPTSITGVDETTLAPVEEDDGTPLQVDADPAPPSEEVLHEAEDPDTFWEAPVTKKKKGKKSKKTSITPIFKDAAADLDPPTTAEAAPSQDSMFESIPPEKDEELRTIDDAGLNDEPATDPATAIPVNEALREAEESDTFWEAPVSKKKKGKKSKRASITPSSALDSKDQDAPKESEMVQEQEATRGLLPTQEAIEAFDGNRDVEMSDSSQALDPVESPPTMTQPEAEDVPSPLVKPTFDAPEEDASRSELADLTEPAFNESDAQQIGPAMDVESMPVTTTAYDIEQDHLEASLEPEFRIGSVEDARSPINAADMVMEDAAAPTEQSIDTEQPDMESTVKELASTSDGDLTTPFKDEKFMKEGQDGMVSIDTNQPSLEYVERELEEPKLPNVAAASEEQTSESIQSIVAHAGNAEDADSFWTPLPSKKKGKKSKKNQSASFTAEPEVPVEDEISAAPILQEDDASRAAVEVPASSTQSRDNPEVVLEDDLEFWPTKSKGKKGKKAKQSAISGPSETREVIPESTIDVEEPSIPLPESTTDERATPAEPAEAVDDEPVEFWPTKTKGKKGKKAKKSSLLNSEPANETATVSEPLPIVEESSTPIPDSTPTETATPAEPAEPEPEEFWATSVKAKKSKRSKKLSRSNTQTFEEPVVSEPATQVDESSATIPQDPNDQATVATEAGQPEADEWATPVKGKKGKKSKNLSRSNTQIIDKPSVADPVTEVDGSAAPLPEFVPDQTTIESETAEPDFDQWATPAKGKKGKKDKKSKRAQTFDTFEETDPATGDPAQSQDQGSTEAAVAGERVETMDDGRSVDQEMRDFELDTAPKETVDAGLLPAFGSSSLPPEGDAQMAVDEFSRDPASELVGEPHSENLPESMDVDNGQIQPESRLDGISDFVETQTNREEQASLVRDVEASPSREELTSRELAGSPDPASVVDPDYASLPHVEGQSTTIDDALKVPLPGDGFIDDLQDPISEDQRDLTEVSTSDHVAQDTNDYDFAAHLARGLEDSGFDPNLVASDPVFQRRASPPGAVAEADPEEIFTPISKKKKGKKGKKKTENDNVVMDTDQPEQEKSISTPAEPSDDFNDTLEKTLAGTGFSAALLQQAASSSNDVSSNEIGGGDFNFTSSKKKKGKKSKRAQRESEIFSEAAEPAVAEGEMGEGMDVQPTALPQDEASKTVHDTDESFEQAPQVEPIVTFDEQMEEDKDLAQPPQESALDIPPPTTREDTETMARDVQFEQPTAHVAMGGGDEMDVDEQDRIYQAFRKKSKRDKKKKRLTASQPDTPAETPMEEYSDPTERTMPPPTSQLALDEDVPTEEDGVRAVENDETPSAFDESKGVDFGKGTAQAPTDGENARGFERFSDVVNAATTAADSRDLSHEDRGAGFGNLSDVVSAATAATGIGAAASQIHNDGNGHSRSFDVREPATASDDYRTADQAGPSWSFANLDNEGQPLPESPLLGNKAHDIVRDSGYQTLGSPSTQRDSSTTARGLPDIYTSESRESLRSRRSTEPLQVSTDDTPDWDLQVPKSREIRSPEQGVESQHERTPSSDSKGTDLESSTKNRASYLFQTTPETLRDASVASATPTSSKMSPTPQHPRGTIRAMAERFEETPPFEMERDTFSPPPAGTMSPRAPLDPIPEEHHAQKRTVSDTDAKDHDHFKASCRSQTPQAAHTRDRGMSSGSLPPMTIPSASSRSISNPLSASGSIPTMDDDQGGYERSLRHMHSRQASADQRSPSAMSNRSNKSAGQYRSPDELRSYSRTSNRSSTPTLRRTSLSGDLRAASRRGDAGAAVRSRASLVNIRNEAPPTPPSGDEIMDAGASRSVDMSDVFQGYGGSQASQVSPTRPPSMRKRQSMHIIELESRLDQLTAENQALHDARSTRSLSGDRSGMQEAINSRDLRLREKDNEISQMRTMLQPMQAEINRLTEINNGLTEANRGMVDEGNSRYATLQQEHDDATRELADMRQEHGRLTSGVRAAIEAELATALADKNAEIRQLREELDVASEKIRSLQVQIQSTKGRDFLTVRDEDYFDGACQKLCQHVQQWVLRFSKMSDDRVCRLSTDIKDDKVEGRLDNAILDGSDVDKLLGDRIKRRDVFMSVVMTMVWEFIFTRYLFGMDREQRQKLKALEKILAEVGPPRAVAQWRATTLTLLSKRPQFAEQKTTDTEAVAGEIFSLLCMLLPPPSNAHSQLISSLQKVIGVAVDLSIEMRTQRAEYIMLPPLQPEYDTNGDLMRKVHFNASLMNERSGMFSSNEELEDSRAVVKIVLFPLVVKKGDEVGEGEEEIVVCPAQVLVHNENARGKKIVRVQSGALPMEIDDPRRSRQSLLSAQGSAAF